MVWSENECVRSTIFLGAVWPKARPANKKPIKRDFLFLIRLIPANDTTDDRPAATKESHKIFAPSRLCGERGVTCLHHKDAKTRRIAKKIFGCGSAAARHLVSPRRHGAHGDFTEASGFSVHLRVLRGREKKFKLT